MVFRDLTRHVVGKKGRDASAVQVKRRQQGVGAGANYYRAFFLSGGMGTREPSASLTITFNSVFPPPPALWLLDVA